MLQLIRSLDQMERHPHHLGRPLPQPEQVSLQLKRDFLDPRRSPPQMIQLPIQQQRHLLQLRRQIIQDNVDLDNSWGDWGDRGLVPG